MDVNRAWYLKKVRQHNYIVISECVRERDCVCVCVCVCVCMCVRVCKYSYVGIFIRYTPPLWGCTPLWGYPHSEKSLVKQSKGSMQANKEHHLALVASSIFSPQTGKKSYVVCIIFLYIFGLLIAFFVRTSYEYTPWKWGNIHVPVSMLNIQYPHIGPIIHVCVCVCVCG